MWCLLVQAKQLLCKAEQQSLVIVGFFHFSLSPLSSLQLHNYIGLAWCDFCRNFMWGLRNQGYRCKGKQTLSLLLISPNTWSLRVSLSDCGDNVHKQCRGETGLDCQPSRLLVKRVYCVELTTLVKMHGTKVPVVVSSCIEEVEKRGTQPTRLYTIAALTSLYFY